MVQLLTVPMLSCFLMATVVQEAASQIYRLPNPGEKAGDFFGVSVDIEGSRAVVGASGSDSCGPDSGAAFVYEADSTTGHWNHVATLVADDCLPGDFFGRDVDLSGDRVVVAAFRPAGVTNRPNAAYVFERDRADGTWQQTARLNEIPSDDEGAYAAAVAIDGEYVVVTTSGDPVADKYHGAGYVYRKTSEKRGSWRRWQRIVPSESPSLGVFGTSAVLRDDVLVVGASTYLANRPGSVYFLRLNGSTGQWEIQQRFGGLNDFFLPVDVRGRRAIVGERRAGSSASGRASVFERGEDGRWSRSSVVRPARPFPFGAFGSKVALGDDRALVVGFDEQLRFEFNIDRVVYVFENVGATEWRQRHIVDVGEVAFGSDLAVDGGLALIGKAADAQPGAAYIVQLH
ncbi:MAG: FG-GAP repeat protein [Rhodothermales bacterium]|nr:FG-GAP repeat protein [Rhodothermales bacterium]